MSKVYNITSANSSVSALTSVGTVNFEGYATDRKWAMEVQEYIERERSADGKLVMAFVPQINDIKFTFQSASPTLSKLDLINQAQKLARSPLPIKTLTMILPSIGKKFIFLNGALCGMPQVPSAAKKLEPVEVVFTFDEVIPMPI